MISTAAVDRTESATPANSGAKRQDHSTPRPVEPRIRFIEDTHTYLLDGNPVPSVTEIIKPMVDLTRVPPGVLEFKRSLGKAVHKAIELYERQDLDVDTLDQEAMPFFEAWLKFKAETGFRAVLTEQIVWSAKLRYAGTLDVLGSRYSGPDADVNVFHPDELLDCKCVWTMGSATGPQTAGYALALQESHGIKVKKRGGLQLLRDGTFKFFPYTSANDENVFKACLAIHAFMRNHK